MTYAVTLAGCATYEEYTLRGPQTFYSSTNHSFFSLSLISSSVIVAFSAVTFLSTSGLVKSAYFFALLFLAKEGVNPSGVENFKKGDTDKNRYMEPCMIATVTLGRD